MKKIFKNWKFVFAATLLALFLVFFIQQLLVQVKPPSKGWSREILVKSVTNQDVKDFGMVRVSTVPVPDENRFIIFWNEDKFIKYESINKDGVQGQIKSINADLDEPSDLKAVLNNGRIELYTLDSGKLNRIILDYNSGKVLNSLLIGNDVKAFFPHNGELLYCGENYIKFLDEKGNSKIIDKDGGEALDAVVKDSLYKIALMKTDESQISHLKYGVFNSRDLSFSINQLGNYVGSSDVSQSIDSISIGINDDKVHIIVPMRNLKTNNTRTVEFSFKESDLKNPEIRNLDLINGYNPDPTWIEKNSNEMDLLASVVKIKGKKTETYNIQEFIMKDNDVIPGDFLTNTNDISINQHYFKLGRDSYLQWENVTGSSKDIMFASTNQIIQTSAGKLKPAELQNVFLDSIMAMVFALSYLILIFSIVMMPTLILVVIASVFFMSWVEANPQKSTVIAVIVHVFAELILAKRSLLTNKVVLGLTPVYMHNSVILYSIVIILGLITYLCIKFKYRGNLIDKSFINQYAFFSVLNMILFSFLIFPYYYL